MSFEYAAFKPHLREKKVVLSHDYGNAVEPGRYKVVNGKHVKMGSELVLQGLGAEFGKFFSHGDRIIRLRSGCFDASINSGADIRLLLNHDEKSCLGTRNDGSLQIHSGAKSLAFRFLLRDSPSLKFSDYADDVETYLAVSCGFNTIKSEKTNIAGTEVTTIVEASLKEISLLAKPPAITTTYARVKSWQTCGTLEDDYATGLFDLAGRVIAIHRKITADENGGPVSYAHATSPYDRAANAFQRALSRLEAD
jgi:HK97 family phage prohead protease